MHTPLLNTNDKIRSRISRYPVLSMFASISVDHIFSSAVIQRYVDHATAASLAYPHVQVGPSTWHAKLLLDTGSAFSLINEEDIPQGTDIHQCNLQMLSSNGFTSPVSQYVVGSVIDQTGQRVHFPLLVTKNLPYVVIGSLDLVHFGYSLSYTPPHHIMQKLSLLYSSGAPPEQPHPELVQDEAHLAEFLKALVPLIETNKNVSGLCNHPQATFELEFLPNIDLSNIDARSYIPPALQEGFDNQVADWRDKNFIELLPKGWTGAEMGFTAVSQPEKTRYCVNSTYINRVIVTPSSNFPSIGHLYNRIRNKKVFIMSQLDMTSAYNAVRWVQGKDKAIYFHWRNEKWMFVRMPFGFSSSPSKFTSLMQAIFGQYDWLIVYFDNLLIISESYEEHLEHVKQVFVDCNEHELKLNPAKSQFLCTTLPFLGFILSTQGVTIDPKKVAAIKNIPIPTTVKQLQRFIGAITFNRSFLVNIATLLNPLYAVNTERVKGQFTKEQQTIVNEFVPQIKDALSKAILVSFPPEDRNIPLVIYTDASDYAIGATIGYFNEANEFVNLGTHSRSLHGYEQRYTTTKKELLAAFDGVQTFTHLLHGYKSITLYTDHNPLCFTSAKKEDLARTESIWWTELSHWPITFKHIPGIDNVLADYLSRDLYLDESGKPTPNTSLFSDIEIEPSTFSSHQSFFSFATTRNMALTKNKLFSPATSSGSSPAQPTNNTSSSSSPPLPLQSPTSTTNKPKSTSGSKTTKPRTTATTATPLSASTPPFTPHPPSPTSPATTDLTPSEWNELIKQVHRRDHGHAVMTAARIHQMGIYHPRLIEMAKLHIAQCTTCLQFNQIKRTWHSAQSVSCNRPWYHVQIDLIGPLPTSNGYTHILIVVDVFTSYVLLHRINSKHANEIVDALSTMFADRGPPKIIQSDNGSEFANTSVKKAISKALAELRLSAAYHPQSNGKVERHVGIFKSILFKLLHDNKEQITQWSQHVKEIQVLINTRPNRFYGICPFYLANGYNTDESYGVNFEATLPKYHLPEWYAQQSALMNIHEEVAQVLAKQHQKVRNSIDNSHRIDDTPIPVGSKVLIENHADKSIGSPTYIGPFIVTGMTDRRSYLMKDMSKPNDQRRIVPRHMIRVLTTDPNELVMDEYVIEAIHGVQNQGTADEKYLLQWLGYKEMTWEPKHLIDAEAKRLYLEGLATAPKDRPFVLKL